MSLETYPNPNDRRTEPRRPASGQVELRPEWIASTTSVPGEMLDIHSGGFRARHSFQEIGRAHV